MIQCPSCGAELERPMPLERRRDCPHCGHRVHAPAEVVSAEPDAGGNLAAPAWLSVGRGVRLHGQPFAVTGSARLVGRYRALHVHWLESCAPAASFDDASGHPIRRIEWDGERYRLLRDLPAPAFMTAALEAQPVGGTVDDAGERWLVVERAAMEVIRRSGVPPDDLMLNAPVHRLDAVGGGRHRILERVGERTAGFEADWLDASSLWLDPVFDRALERIDAPNEPTPPAIDHRPTLGTASPIGSASARAAVIYSCARCGGSLDGHFGGAIRIVCRRCGASTDVSGATGDATLDAAARSFDHALANEREAFGVGSDLVHDGTRWQVVGVQTFAGARAWRNAPTKSEFAQRYTVWWMLNDRREIAWIGEQAGVRFWSEPTIPDEATLPPETSTRHAFGRWTLVDAAGEFPYRVTPGERHDSIETGPHDDGLTIESFLDEHGEPWRIQFTATRRLDDLEVLAALGASDTVARIRRWRAGKTAALFTAIASVASIPLVYDSTASQTIVLPIVLAFVSIVLGNTCEATATGIGHRTAYLTREPERERDAT